MEDNWKDKENVNVYCCIDIGCVVGVKSLYKLYVAWYDIFYLIIKFDMPQILSRI